MTDLAKTSRLETLEERNIPVPVPEARYNLVAT